MKKIDLTKGKIAIIDDEDFEIISKYKWYCSYYGYAVRTIKENGKSKMIWMHRELIKTPQDMKTDHINGNPLDNRKNNLRVCTQPQNLLNRKPHKGYKGVSFHTQNKNWRARIMIGKKEIALGCYKTAQKAAIAYNNAVKKYHGEFGRLNYV